MQSNSSFLTEAPAVRNTVFVLSLLVFAAVAAVVWGRGGERVAAVATPLATVNAALNGASALALIAGFVFIRRKKVVAHRACMVTAFALSSVFLVTYLIHHASVGSVAFGGQGFVRAVYFALLVPHILLAAVIVPLALFTLYRAVTGRFADHRRIARYTLPIWLYVSVSGVLVYWMLYWL